MMVTLSEYEAYHRARIPRISSSISLKEAISAAVITLAILPFWFMMFFNLPVIGQITVGFSLIMTTWFFIVRRSYALFGVVFASALLAAIILANSIQAIKYNIDLPMFLLMALGIPVSAIYCLFIGSRIWAAVHPEDDGVTGVRKS
jgi:hypothetical protein